MHHALKTLLDSVSSLSGLVLCVVFGPNLFFDGRTARRQRPGAKLPAGPLELKDSSAARTTQMALEIGTLSTCARFMVHRAQF